MGEYLDINVEELNLEDEEEEGEDGEADGMKLLDLNPLDELILDTGPGTPRSWRYSLSTDKGIHQLSRDGQLEELKRLLTDESVQAKINNLDEKKCSPLHYATRYSHMEIVNLLLEQPTIVVDRVGADQMTPFHYGCRYGRHEEHGLTRRRSRIDEETELEEDYLGIRVLKKLLQRGANVDAKDAYNMTGLHHAAMRGNISVVKFLVSSLGANQLLNQSDIQGSTALHIASTYGHAEVVKLLLDAGADIRLICQEKKTALHRAAQEGNIQVMKVLLEHDEFSVLAQRKDKDQYSVLLLAVDGGCLDLVQLLLEHGLQPQVSWKNNVGEVPLHSAARTGLKDMVQTLVENGADIDCTNSLQQTPLYIAALSGKLEIVEYLLEQDADHNIWDSQRLSPIMIAGVEGHVQIVRVLKEKGANVRSVDRDDLNILHLVSRTNQSLVLQEISTYEECENLLNANNQFDETPLHIAADAGNVDCVKILLEIGGDVDNKNEDEQTPCHLAARSGHAEVIRVILEKDKNAIFDKDEDEQTPLHIASKYQRADCLKILLENNAKVQDRNNKGWTPLDCAAAAGAFRCAEILLEYNSPVDPTDKKMTTPLHLAAQFGHSKVVELLLKNSADVTLTNLDGENALEIAIIHGKKSVAETILTSDVWRLSLRSTSTVKDSRGTPVPNTPLRMLIRTFPDLAELVFDKCLSVKKLNRKDSYGRKSDRVVELDFEFLEDIFNLQEVGTGEMIRFEYCDCDEDNNVRPFTKPYNDNGDVRKKNHPLIIMGEQKEKYLLKHPLCVALVRHKWQASGKYVFYFQLMMYIMYLISITGYTLVSLNPQTFPSVDEKSWKISTFNQSRTMNTLGLSGTQIAFRVLVYIFTGLGVLIELWQLFWMKTRYLNLSNFIDLVVYSVSSVFVSNFSIYIDFQGCTGPKCWQWPIGSFLLTLAWLNLLGYIRQLPYFGIYVIMFFDILKTVLKLSVILAVFLVAFGLGFNLLLAQHPAFDSIGYSVLKTMVMATGEYEFEGIFMDAQLPFPGATVFMFVIFVLVMAIIMMNLLVGLAVDDIKEVQDHAELKKLSSQVEQIFELEKILPSFILKKRSVQKITLDSKEPTFWKLKDVMTKQNIWETITEREQRREKNEGLDDLMKSLDNIKEEISEKMIKLQSEFSTQMKLLREELRTDGN